MTRRSGSGDSPIVTIARTAREFFSRLGSTITRAATTTRRFLDRYWLPGRARRWAATRSVRLVGLVDPEAALSTYQPVVWVVAKVVAIIVVMRAVVALDVELGRRLSEIVGFFQLEEIYNFELPTLATYTRWSRLALLGVAGLGGGYLLILQVQALFSTVILDRAGRTLYYIEGYAVFRRVHTVELSRLEVVTLRQWLLTRLVRIGTLDLAVISGERLVIRSLWRAPQFVAALRRVTRDPDDATVQDGPDGNADAV